MATQTKRDYYEVLGVTRAATEQEIRRAFERLAAAFRAAGKPRNIEDVEEIRAIATAHRLLSDPVKRRDYDQTGSRFHEESTIDSEVWTNLEEAAKRNWERAHDLVGVIIDGIFAGIE